MPTLTVTKNYQDATTLTQTQLDQAMQSIETFVNTTKLDSDNLQDAAVEENNIGTGAVSASKLASDSVTTIKILDSNVTTAKIADANVTGAKLAPAIVDDSTLQLSSNVLKIKDGGVTQAKRAALGQQISSSCGDTSASSTSYTDISNLSVTITTTGRPVYLGLIGETGTLLTSNISITSGSGVISFIRDATRISEQIIIGTSGVTAAYPPSAISHIDVPSAGTYTYKLQGKRTDAPSVGFKYMKLIAFEL